MNMKIVSQRCKLKDKFIELYFNAYPPSWCCPGKQVPMMRQNSLLLDVNSMWWVLCSGDYLKNDKNQSGGGKWSPE